jgi:hypothetical protein
MQDRWHTRRAASRWIGCGFLTLALAAISACGQMNSTGRASSYLLIDLLQAASGAKPDTFSTTLQSDVLTKGSIYEDPGKVTLRIALKDPGTAASPNAPTTTNWVTVTRSHVSFRRSDGRNTQGVDVPYAFDGAATGTFDSAGGSLVFVLVRAQAKLESPLAELRGSGGDIIISTLADVTFYGQDQNGNQVAVTGTISVNFADWADPA